MEPLEVTVYDVAYQHVKNIQDDSDITTMLHPDYTSMLEDYELWRDCYEAGSEFIEDYLERLSDREGDSDFERRKNVAVCPAFAAAAVDEVKDSIYQRSVDVKRPTVSKSYTRSVSGNDGGVDLSGSTMNTFIGHEVLPELLSMSKVGVFVDMPVTVGTTLLEAGGARPYLYIYKVEQILNWEYKDKSKRIFKSLLLSESFYETDETSGLPTGIGTRYRYLFTLGEKCYQQLFDEKGNMEGPLVESDLPYIPFVLFDMGSSLLENTAKYQVALLNLASSDIAYALSANFPFYVEQYDPKFENPFLRKSTFTSETGESVLVPGTAVDAATSKEEELVVGTLHGRRVSRGLELPKFINPSSEPLEASIKLQDKMQSEIRLLTSLSVAKYASGRASAESKSFDTRGLEAGLSAIGLELARGETLIATIWAAYENLPTNDITVSYPDRYTLASDSDKREEAADLLKSTSVHPSLTYKKEAFKRAVALMLGSRVSSDVLDKINTEIDSSNVLVHDPEELARDLELTIVDPETVSKAKGYPEGSVAKAEVAHAKRVTRIAESQMKARGATDLGGLANASRAEKMEVDTDDSGERGVRGEE